MRIDIHETNLGDEHLFPTRLSISHQDRFKFANLFRGNFGFFECLLKINFDYLKYGSCAELYFI